jgi:tRNA dimethylallyltransferase
MVAKRLGGEIISADSRQVYRGMTIGTGKDYEDYAVEGKIVPVHLIDIADPGHKYNVFEFQRDFLKVYTGLKQKNVFPVVCGGSGLYIDSIVRGYKLIEVPPDPSLRKALEEKSMEELTGILQQYKSLHNVTDTDTKKRVIRAIEIEKYYHSDMKMISSFPEIKPLITGVKYDRESRRQRISVRLKLRLKNGMVEEVKSLLERGIDPEILIYYGLEYKYVTLYLTGKLSYDDMVNSLETAIHRFAKRQMTWFRGMEKKGTAIRWLDGNLPIQDKVQTVLNWLNE